MRVFTRILIANRGEIACRIIKTATAMGIDTVAVYSDADKHALHVKLATVAVHIGTAPATESYLLIDKIVQAAVQTGAEAIHPGYGFLSENPDFVEAVAKAGLRFIGPSASAIRAMGLKDAAKQRMADAGVPVVPGYHGTDQDAASLKAQADKIGYPLLIKARSGGGGKGMRLVNASGEFNEHLASAVREAQNAFGDPVVLLEKFIDSPRHIEVQVFGDSHGNVVHLFERDCTLQRRHQKVIEEAPAPGMSDEVRQAMTDAAITAASAIEYTSAGTIEFIVDGSEGLRADGFWFMEMNTRLQVEHPVTESITGVDLVEWQIRVAAGQPIPLKQSEIHCRGHSVEARLYAEDPAADFLPVAGELHRVSFPTAARIDTGVETGDSITPFYDPMIAKITTTAKDRDSALQAMSKALADTHIAGTTTNLGFLSALIANQEFRSAQMDTGLIARHLESLLPDVSDTPIDRLLACVVLAGLSDWDAKTGWRLWGEASVRVKLSLGQNPSKSQSQNAHQNQSNNANDVVHRINLSPDGSVRLFLDEHDDGSLDDASIESAREAANERGAIAVLHSITGHEIRFSVGGESRAVSYALWTHPFSGDQHLSLKTPGHTHTYRSKNPLTPSQNAQSSSNTITAPMTGVIRVVHEASGKTVKAGAALLVMEAMKMETTLVAPRDARIDSVLCAAGDAVNDGDVLIRFEEPGPEPNK